MITSNQELPTSLDELKEVMSSCEQTKGQSVLEHGESVFKYFQDLYYHLIQHSDLKLNWKLPEWIYEKSIVNNLINLHDIMMYQVYHDCGKPFCKEIDEDGRVHFPNHAAVSEQVWKSVYGEGDVSELIRRDMDIHLLKNDGVDEFANSKYAATLMLTGLCEVHSNSEMFGGIDSTSFKIKWKQINRRGKAIVKKMGR